MLNHHMHSYYTASFWVVYKLVYVYGYLGFVDKKEKRGRQMREAVQNLSESAEGPHNSYSLLQGCSYKTDKSS